MDLKGNCAPILGKKVKCQTRDRGAGKSGPWRPGLIHRQGPPRTPETQAGVARCTVEKGGLRRLRFLSGKIKGLSRDPRTPVVFGRKVRPRWISGVEGHLTLEPLNPRPGHERGLEARDASVPGWGTVRLVKPPSSVLTITFSPVTTPSQHLPTPSLRVVLRT